MRRDKEPDMDRGTMAVGLLMIGLSALFFVALITLAKNC